MPAVKEAVHLFSVRLSPDQVEQLRRIAAADDRKPTSLARKWILDGLRAAIPQNQEASMT